MSTLTDDPALYIFTSLTAGSSHIVTATSRLETILRANRIPFKALDIATDQKARMLWGRRAGKDPSGRVRKLPGLVQEGLVIGDIVEIEEWNEYRELKQHVKIYYDENTIPNIHYKYPVPKLRRPVQKASAAAGTAAAAAGASKTTPTPNTTSTSDKTEVSTGTPAPANPPPAPEPKKSTPAAIPAKKTEKKEEALPIRSVADEAAQKAKELRLKSLREKVHGKEGAAAIEKKKAEEKAGVASPKEEEKTEGQGKPDEKKEAEVTKAAVDKKESEDDDDEDDSEEESSSEEESDDDEEESSEEESEKENKQPATPAPKPAGIAMPGLQSPTSGTWKQDLTTQSAANVQSPTSATWKPAPLGAIPTLSKDVNKPATEAAKLTATATTPAGKPAPKGTAAESSDEDDDDDDDDEEDEEEESSEEDDSEDDEEDSDEESSEDDEKTAAKPTAAAAATTKPDTPAAAEPASAKKEP